MSALRNFIPQEARVELSIDAILAYRHSMSQRAERPVMVADTAFRH